MEKDKRANTIQQIKESAITEFLEKGYLKASLRSICQRANVTTGAFYFSFESKAALLDAIVQPLITTYEEMIVRFRALEMARPEQSVELDKQLMGFLMSYRREALIVLERSEGSRYAMYRDKVLELMVESFRMYFTNALGETPDMNLIRILAAERLQGCLDIIEGDYDMDYAMYLVEMTGIYANGGADSLIKSMKENR